MIIESEIIKYLSTKLTVPVYAEVPRHADSEFCVVLLEGSSESNQISSASVSVMSYSTSAIKAAVLDDGVKKAMSEIVSRNDFSSCKLSNSMRDTDTQNKWYRYSSFFNLVFY